MKDYKYLISIPSDSNSDKSYQVKVDENGNLTCNCKSWINDAEKHISNSEPRECKHTRKIKQAGFDGGKGRFVKVTHNHYTWLTSVGWEYCKDYPDGCPNCSLRFVCWTEEVPDFTWEEWRKAKDKVVNENRNR